ncbi:hypothetical protein [Szabonella alba]|uniref:SnoaL-like domain-containing protein n=1 Tax=Szabonella alba TaxID=2804194 RepID=A0A8K0Y1B1_9RHOB|nr:hypothetical protein [Szabonella alba]MBL4918676.1 hypothetical protein [Szabonella alba]
MTEINLGQDCGNSPKNRFVQTLAIAMETGQMTPDDLRDDVTWHRPSAQPVSGRDEVLEELSRRDAPASLCVEHAISHGRTGAACGVTVLKNGDRRHFSHFFEFTNTKASRVAAIKSYG